MLSPKVPEYSDSDDIEAAPKGHLDITYVLDTTKKMSNAAKAEKDENFNHHIYGTLNMIMWRLGMTDDERLQLHTKYPLLGAMREMLELTPGSPTHPSKDENTVPGSPKGGDDGEEVEGPLELERVVEVDDDGDDTKLKIARASGGAQSDEDTLEYDPKRSE